MQHRYHNHTRLSVKVLLWVDFLTIFGASFFINQVNITFDTSSTGLIVQVLFLVFGFQLIMFSLGLYHSKLRDNIFGILRRLSLSLVICFLIFSVLRIFFENSIFINEDVLYICLFSFILCSLIRLILYKFNILGFAKRNVLIIGAGQRAEIIAQRMRRAVDRKNLTIIGFVSMDGDVIDKINEDQTIEFPIDFTDFVVKNNIHEVVVANDERRNNLPVDDLFFCRIRGIQITEILDFIERETGQIAVNLMYPSWVIYSNGFTSTNEFRNSLDWVFNATLAVTLFILTWPIMLLTILAIKIEDGWSSSCLYLQERVGLDGKVFQIIKFRSMGTNAEKDGIKWAQTDDVRVTIVGGFIRKYRIDELPQIFNVLSGDMGFVGPRPERPEFVNMLNKKIPYYNERHNVKSGLTGWAQLKYPYGASENDAQEKLKYDLYYIKHRSFFLDLMILIQTAEIVLFGKGR